MTTTTDIATTVDTHIAAYCDPDPVRRAERFASVWAAGGELLDPPLEGRGLDEITALTDVVLATTRATASSGPPRSTSTTAGPATAGRSSTRRARPS